MLEQSKHRTEAPVNGGRNYNGPKVAKLHFIDKKRIHRAVEQLVAGKFRPARMV